MQPELLGFTVRDRITGFQGVATGRTLYLNGCVRYTVEGRVQDDGKLPVEWFDEARLEIVEKDKAPSTGDDESPGGPVAYDAPVSR